MARDSVWAAVYCRSTDRLLLALRAKNVNNGNVWNLFGGGIEKGEYPRQAIRRELWEEAGLVAPLLPIGSTIYGSRNLYYYVAVLETEVKFTLNEESAKAKWVAATANIDHKKLHKPTQLFFERMLPQMYAVAHKHGVRGQHYV